jgi:hypothetical protein
MNEIFLALGITNNYAQLYIFLIFSLAVTFLIAHGIIYYVPMSFTIVGKKFNIAGFNKFIKEKVEFIEDKNAQFQFNLRIKKVESFIEGIRKNNEKGQREFKKSLENYIRINDENIKFIEEALQTSFILNQWLIGGKAYFDKNKEGPFIMTINNSDTKASENFTFTSYDTFSEKINEMMKNFHDDKDGVKIIKTMYQNNNVARKMFGLEVKLNAES